MNTKFRISFVVIFVCVLGLLFSLFLSSEEQTLQSVERGGVVLTFDDYYVDDWYAANQHLADYDWKATFFASEFHFYSQEEIGKLKTLQSQGHEIGLHGKNHINVLEFTSSNSMKEYIDNEVLPALNAMREEGFEINSFAYPFGAKTQPNYVEKFKKVVFADYIDKMDNLLLEHFDILRGTANFREIPSQQRNYANGSPLIFGLGIDNSYNNNTEYLLSLLQYANENDKIVIFYGHRILPKTDSLRYVTHYETLEKICRYVTKHDMHFLTMRDLVID